MSRGFTGLNPLDTERVVYKNARVPEVGHGPSSSSESINFVNSLMAWNSPPSPEKKTIQNIEKELECLRGLQNVEGLQKSPGVSSVQAQVPRVPVQGAPSAAAQAPVQAAAQTSAQAPVQAAAQTQVPHVSVQAVSQAQVPQAVASAATQVPAWMYVLHYLNIANVQFSNKQYALCPQLYLECARLGRAILSSAARGRVDAKTASTCYRAILQAYKGLSCVYTVLGQTRQARHASAMVHELSLGGV